MVLDNIQLWTFLWIFLNKMDIFFHKKGPKYPRINGQFVKDNRGTKGIFTPVSVWQIFRKHDAIEIHVIFS